MVVLISNVEDLKKNDITSVKDHTVMIKMSVYQFDVKCWNVDITYITLHIWYVIYNYVFMDNKYAIIMQYIICNIAIIFS